MARAAGSRAASGFPLLLSAVFSAGVILYQFGSGPVQGFALTLMIGIVTSMFAAVFITRVIFNVMSDRSMRVNFG